MSPLIIIVSTYEIGKNTPSFVLTYIYSFKKSQKGDQMWLFEWLSKLLFLSYFNSLKNIIKWVYKHNICRV